MKKFLNTLLTGFALFFSIPTFLILASWNALPGSGLYSVKSSLEDVALALTGNTRLARSFSVSFTERRYDEAVKLLAKEGSTVGYDLLVAEAKQTRNMVLTGQDVKSGAELAHKITKYQTEIAAKKAEVQAQTATPAYTPPATPKPTPQQVVKEVKTIVVVQPVEIIIREEEPAEVLNKLDEVEDELEEILEDLEELPDTTSGQEETTTGTEEVSDQTNDNEDLEDDSSRKKPKNKD